MKEENELSQDVINEDELEALSGGISATAESLVAGVQGLNHCCNGTNSLENAQTR